MHEGIQNHNFLTVNWSSDGVNTPVHTRPVFSSTVDKYLYWYGEYSEEEMNFYDKLEKEHKVSLPKYNFNELLEIFPTARHIIKEKLQEEIDKCRVDVIEADRIEKEGEDLIYRKSCSDDEDFWRGVIYTFFVQPLREGREKIIKTNLFRLSSLKGIVPKVGSITEQDIEQAKNYPITELMKFNTSNNAKCIFHTEKSASMHYYKKGNRVQCFGCERAEDAIGIYMQLYSVDFLTAVKALI